MVKSQKGITLTSLMIYVIGMLIAVSVVSVISSYFYKNMTGMKNNTDPYKEYTKLNSFFTDEVNIKNIKILECKTQKNDKNEIISSYIVFNNNVQYEFIADNQGIYRNNVKICKNIKKCTFDTTVENGKEQVKLNFESGIFKNSITYTLSNL